MRKIQPFTFILFLGLLLAFVLPTFAQDSASQDKGFKILTHKLVKHDISPPFGQIQDVFTYSTVKKVHPVKAVPIPAGAANEENASRDPNVQNFTGAMAIPTTNLNFEGIDEATKPSCNCAPPDTNGAVGVTHGTGTSYYVQTVNTTIGIYNKATGALVTGSGITNPKTIQSLWSGFSAPCSSTNDGDPVVAYDQAADRWIVSQFSVSSAPYFQCIAVSTSGDPLGTYARYQYSFGNNFNDYPKIGVWSDGYYITYNLFANGSTFAGGEACAYGRAA